MNANKLTSKDIMVGDWVMSFGAPHKVVGIRTDMLEPHIKTDMSDTWYEEGIENLLDPIPITKELLERNGFNLHDDMYTNDVMTLHDDKKFIKTKNAWSVAVYINECYRINCELTYLHELQNLLRICKINFEFTV